MRFIPTKVIFTLLHTALCKAFSCFARLHASLHPHPRATWQTSRQLKLSPGKSPLLTCTTHSILACPSSPLPLPHERPQEGKDKGHRLGSESWPLTSSLEPQFLTCNLGEIPKFACRTSLWGLKTMYVKCLAPRKRSINSDCTTPLGRPQRTELRSSRSISRARLRAA